MHEKALINITTNQLLNMGKIQYHFLFQRIYYLHRLLALEVAEPHNHLVGEHHCLHQDNPTKKISIKALELFLLDFLQNLKAHHF